MSEKTEKLFFLGSIINAIAALCLLIAGMLLAGSELGKRRIFDDYERAIHAHASELKLSEKLRETLETRRGSLREESVARIEDEIFKSGTRRRVLQESVVRSWPGAQNIEELDAFLGK